jgi:16S rRNA (cytosine1402-N4)-methyltransferase
MSEAAGNAVHVPVMLSEVVDALGARDGGMFLDCTFGGGGHTRAILDADPDCWVVAMDRDSRALERGVGWAGRYGDRLDLVHAPFSRIAEAASGRVFDGVLADLGMSTDQLVEGRGFSFADTGVLDMRMDSSVGMTAADFVNNASEREIFLALAEGGVGKNARSLARSLVFHRPFESARELADAVKGSQLGKRSLSKVHPATVVFQALRMKVNDELGEIAKLLDAAPKVVKPGGKLVVITFHSVEDKAVTGRMRQWEAAGSYPANWRGIRAEKRIGRVVNRDMTKPSEDEVERNPASRSARLRVFQFGENF